MQKAVYQHKVNASSEIEVSNTKHNYNRHNTKWIQESNIQKRSPALYACRTMLTNIVRCSWKLSNNFDLNFDQTTQWLRPAANIEWRADQHINNTKSKPSVRWVIDNTSTTVHRTSPLEHRILRWPIMHNSVLAIHRPAR